MLLVVRGRRARGLPGIARHVAGSGVTLCGVAGARLRGAGGQRQQRDGQRGSVGCEHSFLLHYRAGLLPTTFTNEGQPKETSSGPVRSGKSNRKKPLPKAGTASDTT